MSDISDVATGLAMTIAGIVYPNGPSPVTGSITGRQTIVRRGWVLAGDRGPKNPCSIDNGVDIITVRTLGPSTQEMPADLGAPWRTWSTVASTVTLTVSGNSVTVSIPDGATPSGIVGVKIVADASGALPDNSSATYLVTSADTAASIAVGLAAQFPGSFTSGATLTIPNATSLTTATGGTGLSVRVLSRQVQNLTVSVWSNSWQARDALGKAIITGLMSVLWFPAYDGWGATLTKAPGSIEVDAMLNQGIWRRDIQIAVRYDTIETQTGSSMVFGTGMTSNVSSGRVVLQPFGATPPVTGAISDGNGTFYQDAAGNLVFGVQQPYSGIMVDANGNVILDSAGNLAGNPS